MGALAAVSPKIARMIPRLASDHDGEIVATVRAIRRTLEGAGLDLHALAASLEAEPPRAQEREREPDGWREVAVWCRNVGQTRLTLKEFCFVSDLANQLAVRKPSEKQLAWLAKIYSRLRGAQ